MNAFVAPTCFWQLYCSFALNSLSLEPLQVHWSVLF